MLGSFTLLARHALLIANPDVNWTYNLEPINPSHVITPSEFFLAGHRSFTFVLV
jgi:hypothetical protein